MLRLLRYIVLFLLGYAVIRTIFGKKAVKKGPEVKEMNHQAEAGHHKYDKDSGEYIDYEEMK
jgi:hypothetical protein